MAAKRGLSGTVRLRKKLRRIDELTGKSIARAVEEAAQAITVDAIARAPKDTEELAASIEYSLSGDGLSATVGPAAKSVRTFKGYGFSPFANKSTARGVVVQREMKDLTKDKLFQFFKGYWHEFGTKGAPKRNIPPLPANPFMEAAWDVNAGFSRARVREATNRALKNAARSSVSDA